MRIIQELVLRIRALEDRLADNTEGWAGSQSNVTTDRAFDADSTSTAELADVLGTLIQDLVDMGLIR